VGRWLNQPAIGIRLTFSSVRSDPVHPATGSPGILIGSVPATGEFNQNLFVAFQANDPSHVMDVAASSQVGL
jgi:hypothetical protein